MSKDVLPEVLVSWVWQGLWASIYFKSTPGGCGVQS